MKSTGALALAFALAIATAASLAAANPAKAPGTSGDSMSGMMHGMARERPLLSFALQHAAELGLSAEQEETLRKLVDGFGKEASQRMHDIEAAERELAGLVEQEGADFARIEGKVRAEEKARADLRLVRIRTLAEGRSALTPEQRAKLDQLAAGQGRADRANRRFSAENEMRIR